MLCRFQTVFPSLTSSSYIRPQPNISLDLSPRWGGRTGINSSMLQWDCPGVYALSPVGLFATLWTVANPAPLSMEFFRQEQWSGLPFPSPGHLPNPGIEPMSPVSPVLQADSLPAEPLGIIKHRKFNHYTRLLSYVQFICKCSRVSH